MIDYERYRNIFYDEDDFLEGEEYDYDYEWEEETEDGMVIHHYPVTRPDWVKPAERGY